jgi:hypothetical protein
MSRDLPAFRKTPCGQEGEGEGEGEYFQAISSRQTLPGKYQLYYFHVFSFSYFPAL